MDIVDRLNDLAQRFGMCRDQTLCFDAAIEIRKLRGALTVARNYIEGETIAGAVVAPAGETPTGQHPSLLAFIDAALTGVELKATKEG